MPGKVNVAPDWVNITSDSLFVIPTQVGIQEFFLDSPVKPGNDEEVKWRTVMVNYKFFFPFYSTSCQIKEFELNN